MQIKYVRTCQIANVSKKKVLKITARTHSLFVLVILLTLTISDVRNEDR